MAAKYKVIGSFYYNIRMYEDGEEVEYDGEPGENLHPLNAEAKKAKDAFKIPTRISAPTET